MTPDQQAFEDRCWEHYLAERARRTMPGDVEGEPTREGLFWRREDGLYGVLAFNTAWMAYQWGVQAVRGQGVPDIDALTDAIAEGLKGTYHCTRVWEAWRVGTMGQDDFEPVDESDTPREIAETVIAMLASAPPAPQASEVQQEPTMHVRLGVDGLEDCGAWDVGAMACYANTEQRPAQQASVVQQGADHGR